TPMAATPAGGGSVVVAAATGTGGGRSLKLASPSRAGFVMPDAGALVDVTPDAFVVVVAFAAGSSACGRARTSNSGSIAMAAASTRSGASEAQSASPRKTR